MIESDAFGIMINVQPEDEFVTKKMEGHLIAALDHVETNANIWFEKVKVKVSSYKKCLITL